MLNVNEPVFLHFLQGRTQGGLGLKGFGVNSPPWA